jgi:GTP cyclohydrolase III
MVQTATSCADTRLAASPADAEQHHSPLSDNGTAQDKQREEQCGLHGRVLLLKIDTAEETSVGTEH